ncbi:hypothetical protein OROHE_005367 [Orobanche hederae]
MRRADDPAATVATGLGGWGFLCLRYELGGGIAAFVVSGATGALTGLGISSGIG